MAELYHYGMPRRSGRYPWGSGEDPRSQSIGAKKSEHTSRSEMRYEERVAAKNNPGRRWDDWTLNSVDERQSMYVKIDGEWMSAAKAAKTGKLQNKSSSFSINNINPDFGEHGTMNNCMKCTSAVELKYRGYDVCAGKSIQGFRDPAIADWFDNAETANGNLDDFESFIENAPEGARGYLLVSWTDGGGHAIHWTKTPEGYQIEDGQTGKIYTSVMDMAERCGNMYNDFVYARLDNCKIDWEAMDKDSVLSADPNKYETGVYDRYRKDISPDEEYMVSHNELDATGKSIEETLKEPIDSPKVEMLADEGKKEVKESKTLFEKIGDIAAEAVDNWQTGINQIGNFFEDLFGLDPVKKKKKAADKWKKNLTRMSWGDEVWYMDDHGKSLSPEEVEAKYKEMLR